jgi:uncharacterized protein (TIGR03083 family)
MGAVDLARQLQSIKDDGRRIGDAARAGPTDRVVSCPEWTGLDLLAHVCGFVRFVRDLLDGTATRATPAPVVDGDEALQAYDADVALLLATLSATPADAPAPNWSVAPDTAAFWMRRAVHELAVHRWDAETIADGRPASIAVDVATDGIAEFFDVFVATGLAAGMVPPTQATLALELTDTGERIEYHLPEPGPVTTMRGPASDLLLALWRRRDPLAHHAGGDRGVLEAWPKI